jgi:hypothetical protein
MEGQPIIETSVVRYSGWIRFGLRGRWRLFCRAAREQAVLDILMREAPRGSDKLVRQGDRDPNDDEPSRPRRRI